MKLSNKIAIVALITFLISNPLLGQYLLTGIDWVFQQIFIYGGYVCALAGLYLSGYIGFVIYKQERTKIPKTNKKSKVKTSQYISD